jgi:hypothetical protein
LHPSSNASEEPAVIAGRGAGAIALGAIACALGSCRGQGEAGPSDAGPTPVLTRDSLIDPTACQSCHPVHLRDWQSSAHANASTDPVFLAMNARGQRETGGQLGAFCVNCHAPMAVRDGLTTDGLNLASVPARYQGVTCFFCHSIDSVDGSHNAAVGLATDLTMRGEYANPVPNIAHRSTYSSLQDGTQTGSAPTCGACHDIVVPDTDAAIERTFGEWSHSVFSTANGSSCAECHMTPSGNATPIASLPGLPARTLHSHAFPAVDVPLDPATADAGGASAAVAQALGSAVQGALCVTGAGGVRVVLDAVAVGHQWPSGAAQDRRAWAEVVAYKGGAVIYQSGVVDGGAPVTGVQGDPDLWLLRDCMFGADGGQVNMFWQASSSESNELPALATFDTLDPRYYQTHIVQRFHRDGTPLSAMPDRVTLRLRLQPIGLDVLDDLVQTQDLDAGVALAMPTFDVPLTGPGGADLEWTPSAAAGLVTMSDDGTPETCVATAGFNVAATQTLAANHTRCAP